MRIKPVALTMIIMLVLFGIFLQACAVTQPAPTQAPKHIKVIMRPYMSNFVLSIAQEEGYFAAQGLDVEFVNISDDTEAMVALMQGDLDVNIPLIDAGILNLMAQGIPIQIVADKGFIDPNGCTSIAFVARKELLEAGTLDDPNAVRDRVFGIEPETLDGMLTEKLLLPLGLTLQDVEAVNLSRPAEMDAIASGSLDVTLTSEPWITRLIQAGNADVWKPMLEVAPDMQYAVILFGPNLLEDDPDAGRRFIVSYLQAVRQYNEGKTERNMELMVNFTGEDPAFLQEACWPLIRSDARINPQSILEFQTWADEKGLLDGLVTVEQFWDPSFIEYALANLDTP